MKEQQAEVKDECEKTPKMQVLQRGERKESLKKETSFIEGKKNQDPLKIYIFTHQSKMQKGDSVLHGVGSKGLKTSEGSVSVPSTRRQAQREIICPQSFPLTKKMWHLAELTEYSQREGEART